MEVGLDHFRFSVAAVLLRLADFAPPAAEPQTGPTVLVKGKTGAVDEEEEEEKGEAEGLDFSLLSASAEGAAVDPSSPPSPPSSLTLHCRMVRPTFQLVADPTAAISPALLFTWSAALSLEKTAEGGRERLKVSGGLEGVTCHVTEVDSDDRETARRRGPRGGQRGRTGPPSLRLRSGGHPLLLPLLRLPAPSSCAADSGAHPPPPVLLVLPPRHLPHSTLSSSSSTREEREEDGRRRRPHWPLPPTVRRTAPLRAPPPSESWTSLR